MRSAVVGLCEGADLVIYDTMFTPEDYRLMPHFGHSRPSDAIEISREAAARTLALYHHAPERSDEEIDAMLARAREQAARPGANLDVLAAYEGLDLPLGRPHGGALMEVTFFGVRGCIASPGPGTVRYGGNTSCVLVRLGDGEIIILDCGTGARNLGISLMTGPCGKGQGRASILLSHAHWDHIQGFPFFLPFYTAGNRFTCTAGPTPPPAGGGAGAPDGGPVLPGADHQEPERPDRDAGGAAGRAVLGGRGGGARPGQPARGRPRPRLPHPGRRTRSGLRQRRRLRPEGPRPRRWRCTPTRTC
jgi:hypothetical protein